MESKKENEENQDFTYIIYNGIFNLILVSLTLWSVYLILKFEFFNVIIVNIFIIFTFVIKTGIQKYKKKEPEEKDKD